MDNTPVECQLVEEYGVEYAKFLNKDGEEIPAKVLVRENAPEIAKMMLLYLEEKEKKNALQEDRK